jgi:hypothetical protein
MEQKVCSSCKKSKPVSEFHKNASKKSGYNCLCKECRLQNSPAMVATNRKRRRQNIERAVQYLGGKCKICGLQSTCYEIYDFHHIDPTQKEAIISQLSSSSWSKVLKEVVKCWLLCAHCHRKLHAGRFTDAELAHLR